MYQARLNTISKNRVSKWRVARPYIVLAPSPYCSLGTASQRRRETGRGVLALRMSPQVPRMRGSVSAERRYSMKACPAYLDWCYEGWRRSNLGGASLRVRSGHDAALGRMAGSLAHGVERRSSMLIFRAYRGGIFRPCLCRDARIGVKWPCGVYVSCTCRGIIYARRR